MSYIINNQQKVNEIIFADRNKAYGAYQLRSEYGATLLKSIAIVGFTMFATFGLAYYYTHKAEAPIIIPEQIIPDVKIITVKLPEDKIADLKTPDQPKTDPAPSSKPNTNSALSTIVKDSVSVVTNTTATNETVGTASTNTTTGSSPEIPGGGGTGTGTTTIIGSNNTEPVIIADIAPEFEGGLAALYKFISSKIKYPVVASSEGVEGTVHVKFVVDEKGNIGNLALLNKKGFGLDEEALRVVAMIPKFKSPGMMGKTPVKVYYQLPIKFKLR